MSWTPGERIRGIDIPLPPGEAVRWEGGPEWRSLAIHAFHARKIAGYFAALLAWRGVVALGEPDPGKFFLVGAVPLLGLGGISVLIAIALAWLTSRSARYAITDRRIVLRIGIVVSSIINLPFRQIRSAALKRYRDGSGDLALHLADGLRVPYFHLWPHARGWRLSRPEPAFRSLAVPDEVSAVLKGALEAIADPTVAIARPSPETPTAPSQAIDAARRPGLVVSR